MDEQNQKQKNKYGIDMTVSFLRLQFCETWRQFW